MCAQWLSVHKAAQYVGLSDSVISKAITTGDLVAYKKPATYKDDKHRIFWRISIDDLDKWMRSQPCSLDYRGQYGA